MPTAKPISIRNNAGFTLLEIIAVMVIMSILAVVAVPKYFDLQSEAKQKAMETAMAESISRVNSWFAKQVLAGNDPDSIQYTDTNIGTDLGDFTLSTIDGGASSVADDGSTSAVDCSNAQPGSISAGGGSGCIQLTVSAKTDTAVAGADDLIDIIPRPGRI
jgi:prepilin-type N-terminal cleavage/methylation domain-containing protein